MATLNANTYYREQQVTTASRGQLLLLVYDGALRFLEEGKRAMIDKRFENQNNNLTKAQALLLELIATLDPQVNPELAQNLNALYRYMYDRLTYANVYDDQQALSEVANLMGELREAWAEADRIMHTQESACHRGAFRA